jgi:hypothetical protein
MRTEHVEPMTLANMRENGVRSLFIYCTCCHHSAELNADAYPDDLPVPCFCPRMVRTRCGHCWCRRAAGLGVNSRGWHWRGALLASPCPTMPDQSMPELSHDVMRTKETIVCTIY